MFKEDAIRFFGGKSKLATAAGVSRPSVTKWGAVIPKLRAMELAELTGGKLSYDPALYKSVSEEEGVSDARPKAPTDGNQSTPPKP